MSQQSIQQHKECMVCKKHGAEIHVDLVYNDDCKINDKGNKIPFYFEEGTDQKTPHVHIDRKPGQTFNNGQSAKDDFWQKKEEQQKQRELLYEERFKES